MVVDWELSFLPYNVLTTAALQQFPLHLDGPSQSIAKYGIKEREFTIAEVCGKNKLAEMEIDWERVGILGEWTFLLYRSGLLSLAFREK